MVEEAGASGDARFRSIEERAAEIAGALGTPGDGARLYGGFSFAPRASDDEAWASFPAARLQFPEVELERRPGDGFCTLVARARSEAAAERLCAAWARALAGEAAKGGPARVALASRRTAFSPRSGATMERASWNRMVEGALSRIRAGEAEKVVLARTLEVAAPRGVGPVELVVALWEENHGSHVFLFEPTVGDAIVGAAPETIAALRGGKVRATAVAGSVGVGADSIETARLAKRLFHSEKDRAEHDFVVRDMVERLTALGCSVRRDVEPHVLALTRIQHLETKIEAVAPAGVSLLDVVASLHPTPAVCGIPRNVALSILTEGEVFDRGWYAGPVGWLAADGKGIFVPALRSAVRAGALWRLYAGAGIVPGSDADLEWEETELKFRPVLRAMARAAAAPAAAAGSGGARA